MVFEISSGPEADLCGSFSSAERSSPCDKSEHWWSSSVTVIQRHGVERARRASSEMTLSAALYFGSLLTEAYSLQNRLVFVKLVEANLPSADEITDEDCADGVLPSMTLITLQISAELSSPRLSVMNFCQRRALASSMVFLSIAGGHLKGLGLVIIIRACPEIFLGLAAPSNGLLHFKTPPGALSFRDPFGMAFLAARAIADKSRALARWT